jgi:tetratricopeptide (TPR) repeat protein
MKTAGLLLFVFFISTFSNYAQSRTKESDRQPVNNKNTKVEGIKELRQTPLTTNEGNKRDTPHNPPIRVPINTTTNSTPPAGRPVSPPSNPINKPTPPIGVYLPIPVYYDPLPVECIYTNPVETVPDADIDHNYKKLGLSQFKKQDFNNALISFELALAKDSLDYSLYYYIGTTEIETGRYDEAVIDLTIFINNIIENRFGFYQRGLANYYLGNRHAALDDFLVADQYQVEEAKVMLKKFFDNN